MLKSQMFNNNNFNVNLHRYILKVKFYKIKNYSHLTETVKRYIFFRYIQKRYNFDHIAVLQRRHNTRNLLTLVFLVAGAFFSVARGQNSVPVPILPDSIHWVNPPSVSGLQAAWVLGAEQQAGVYIIRVKLETGARIPPHTHPDERNTTVLTGTVYVGFGETFDEAKVVAIPAGAVYVTPANVPHYLWAKDGDTMYQEAGMGPTGTEIIKQ